MFTGMIQIRIYGNLISAGSEGGQTVGVDVAKIDRIRNIVGSIEGVSGVSINSVAETLDANYSGPYEKIEDIEKAVAKAGVNCALISPAIVKFRPLNQDNDSKVVSALRQVKGSVGAAKIDRDFCLFIPAEAIDLMAILDACKNAGCPGTIVSHDLYEFTFTKAGDEAKLKAELHETKFVINSKINAAEKKVSITVVRGRCSKAELKKSLDRCGFETK